MTWPILVINLDRSADRWASMSSNFSGDVLTKIIGVDGSQWQKSGETRPMMSEDSSLSLIEQGILQAEQTHPILKPCEIGCALSHKAAWEWIVANDPEYAIVLEDDVEPSTGYVDSLQNSITLQGGMPAGADVLFLSKDDGYDRPELAGGRLGRREGPNYGYLMTPSAAQAAINAQFPMYMSCAEQWKMNISMYVVNESIIKMSDIGQQTCMDYLGE